MSLYVLDSDHLTMAQKGHAAVLLNLRSHAPSDLATTIICVKEQLDGWNDSLPRIKDRAKLAHHYQNFVETVQFLPRFRILSFSEEAMTRFDDLKRLKLHIGKNDLRIAAIALEHDATLVTRNTQDFRRVPGLRTEDWSV